MLHDFPTGDKGGDREKTETDFKQTWQPSLLRRDVHYGKAIFWRATVTCFSSFFGLSMDVLTMEKDSSGKLLPADLATKHLLMKDINQCGTLEGVYVRGT